MSISFDKWYRRKAYSKTNLGLFVDGRLKDGFHAIRSIIARLALCDEVSLRIRRGRGELRFTLNLAKQLEVHLRSSAVTTSAFDEFVGDLAGTNNLLVRAGEMVLANRKDLDFEISLEKLVPPQAGLGGGSADAAALLELLIELEIVPLEEALAIGETLGSDIPALIGSGLRFVYGRGGRQMFLDFDQNSQIASFLNSPLIIIKPPLGMSTPKAYAMLGLKSELSPRSKQFFLESQSSFFDSGRQEREVRGHTADWLGSLGLGLRAPFGVEDSVADVLTLLGLEGTGGRPFSKGVSKDCSTLLFNEFETVVRNSLEVVDSAFTMLKNVGSHHVMLSGSGSSLVGFFDDEASAERACREIGSIVTDEWFVSLSRFVV